MRQHKKPNVLEAQNSAVFNHLVKVDHTFDIDNDVTILDREADWRRRGIKEAIYERIENPTLNRRGGLHFNLPHSWDVVLKGVTRRLPHNKTLVGGSTGHSTCGRLVNPPSGVHYMCSSLDDALDLVFKEPLASKIERVFVIGGAAVYKPDTFQ
ncbi:Dihydrofolate reductase [Exaiptasia diaphana]|nr:Dihydrofolate reductase [Exaiptasia diaphana]